MQRFFASVLLTADPTVVVRSLSELALRWWPSTVTGVSALPAAAAAVQPGPTPHAAAITSPHSRNFSCSRKVQAK
uniref:Uncharacterized protein n=1 Tax=Oryza brachyantha TaxID=4533 RepID=J3MLX9_ORYBR